ncbi:2-deoxyglucose-6-phosphate phosphatase, putative [Entamoeba dispar SAW760]|uniref:2-deoxyglucose-6-phosphate phosphatase, putative n=1 Tax=Entamoeba dispar (strain ATCC PRA-260 / SAW760) TaxID=370354 RepID=B0E8C5_ENTDS|nr:2-deoxyglucose-6-phosphate phosphatase, putative [Entamoeba dispar SAW760]EDR29250.1 2-deoxyglucose-6-phosphate phosphatase, putative [Entamoeba dispar SAW760]|eukprot:EDR29250.1 2-deoxyglucose-6-phosphate phosphatase, putative [Entamoeba dispar SAW760]
MNQITNFIFDFNGTLFDDTNINYLAWKYSFEKRGIYLTKESYLKEHIGKSSKQTIIDIMKTNNTNLISDILNDKNKYLITIFEKGVSLQKGAEQLLNYLKNNSNKYHYVIASMASKNTMKLYFKYLHLEKWFSIDQIILYDKSCLPKPNPELFIKAMNKLNASTQNTVIFEDSLAGLKAAQATHVNLVIAINYQSQLIEAQSLGIHHSFNDFSSKKLQILLFGTETY